MLTTSIEMVVETYIFMAVFENFRIQPLCDRKAIGRNSQGQTETTIIA